MLKWSGNITDHFTMAEYCVNQTEDCVITQDAKQHWDMMEEFRVWYGKPMTISAAYRSSSYNKKVGGNANSNHLRGTASDVTMKITKTEFLKLAKRWKKICESHGVVGEAGYYSNGWIHLGSHINYSKSFGNWWTDSKGVQHNNYFDI